MMKFIVWVVLSSNLFTSLGISAEDIKADVCSPEEIIMLKPGSLLKISSPGFEVFHYPSNSLCFWTVKSDPKVRLLVEFILVSIWPSFNCILDGLILFDGDSSQAPIIGRYCSGTPSDSVETSGPYLHMIFYSSDFVSQQFRGFTLSVQQLKSEVSCGSDEVTCHNKKCVSRSLMCNQIDDCRDGTDEESCSNIVHQNIPCGSTPISPNLESEDRIVGGSRSIPGSWPWQCSLRKKGNPLFGHLCGATLINEQWILTAAHCFRQLRHADQWTVHVGKYFKEKTETTEQIRYIKYLFIHPSYKFERSNKVYLESKECDIALVKMNAPVTITNFVQPVCLPPWRANTASGTLAYVTGWGETLGTGNYDVLKQAAIPIVSKMSCRKSYENITNVTDDMICAGYSAGGHDSCKGDSGGPLVVMRRSRWYVIGLVSTGSSCAAPLQPGIYTSVSHFKTWILKILSNY